MFVDECGTNVGLAPLRAGAPKGERAFGEAPRNRGRNTTLLASMGAGGVGPSLAVEGGTTKAVFKAYVGRVLAPSLRAGQVVVMDNAGFLPRGPYPQRTTTGTPRWTPARRLLC